MTHKTKPKDPLEMTAQLLFNNAEAAINLLTKVQRKIAKGLDVAKSNPQRGTGLILAAADEMTNIALSIIRTPKSKQTKQKKQ